MVCAKVVQNPCFHNTLYSPMFVYLVLPLNALIYLRTHGPVQQKSLAMKKKRVSSAGNFVVTHEVKHSRSEVLLHAIVGVYCMIIPWKISARCFNSYKQNDGAHYFSNRGCCHATYLQKTVGASLHFPRQTRVF